MHVCVDRPEYGAVGDDQGGALVFQNFVDSGEYAVGEVYVGLGFFRCSAISPVVRETLFGSLLHLINAEINFLQGVHTGDRQV